MSAPVRLEVLVAGVETLPLLAVIEQLDDVIRELALIETGRITGMADSPLPAELLATVGEARRLLFGPKELISRQVGEAWNQNRPTVDIRVPLAAAAGPAILSVLEAFEAVDEFARSDSALLIPAAPAAVAAFRRSFFLRLHRALDAAVRSHDLDSATGAGSTVGGGPDGGLDRDGGDLA